MNVLVIKRSEKNDTIPFDLPTVAPVNNPSNPNNKSTDDVKPTILSQDPPHVQALGNDSISPCKVVLCLVMIIGLQKLFIIIHVYNISCSKLTISSY